MPLSDTTIVAAKPGAKPVRMFDGGGLYLEVSPSGGKLWRLKYRFAGKERRLSLGVYPETSLNEARERREAAKGLLAQGTDPGEHVRLKRVQERDEQARQIAATRFVLDSDGALTFRLGNRRLSLTPAETSELRIFLDATRNVACKR